MFLGTSNELTTIKSNLKARDRFAIPYFQQEPAFQYFAQLEPAILKFLGVGPNARQSRNFTEVGAIIQFFVLRGAQFFIDEFAQHGVSLTQSYAGRQ